MLTSMESWLRRGWRLLGALWQRPWVRQVVTALGCAGGGFLFSAGSLLRHALPLALGLIAALPGWQALAAAMGGAVGYWVFWREAGLPGVVCSAAGGLLGVLLGPGVREDLGVWAKPGIAAFLTALTGLVFRLFLGDTTAPAVYAMEIALAFFSTWVFCQTFQKRGTAADWMAGALGCLCLTQLAPAPWLDPGIALGAWVSVTGSLPGCVLAGMGLDLAGVEGVPMTAVLCAAWLMTLLPLEKRQLRFAFPAVAWGFLSLAMGVGGVWAVPALLAGGLAGFFTPPRLVPQPRRGQTGPAQVRLELGAQVLTTTARLLQDFQSPPIDVSAILRQVRQRACGSCSARNGCPETLSTRHLLEPLEADCRKQGRLLPELRRGREQLRQLQAQRRRQEEYREALLQQYRFLGEYLRELSDQLPRGARQTLPHYRVEVGVRSMGREAVNGDRCLAFPGTGCRYYVALCDGMGTGPAAAEAAREAGALLGQMLRAGFPARHALQSLNSLLTLRESAGAVTVDLAEVHLDTGFASLYKWGAAESLLWQDHRREKIGTASAPPGLGLRQTCQAVEKLSLRRGEMLILLSDGVDGEEITRRAGPGSQGPPGELAARLLKLGCAKPVDDATVAVIRLCPAALEASYHSGGK